MDLAASSGEKVVLLIFEEGPAGLSLFRALEMTLAVEWARTAAEVRERAGRSDLRAPKVVFLDLELPSAIGDDVLRTVLGSFPLAAVVALADNLGGEDAARLLWQGVPYLNKPVSALALAGLALRLSSPTRARARKSWPPTTVVPALLESAQRGAHLESVFRSYSVNRVLSAQQQLILRKYLNGKNDKEIAETCRCSEATVYEHWRRMARKAGGSQKSDVIADFHRFLAGD
jgi:DNA-binding NarL/FixJ family response regulator